MAKENEFRFSSASVAPSKSIKAGFDLQTGEWEAKADVQQFKDQAKLERDRQAYFGKSKSSYRKMATIPDIIAIKINQDHGIDLHDRDRIKKLRYILTTEYPDLMINS